MYTCNTLYAFFACIIHPIWKHQAFHLFNAFFPVYLGRICCSKHTGTYIMGFFQPKSVLCIEMDFYFLTYSTLTGLLQKSRTATEIHDDAFLCDFIHQTVSFCGVDVREIKASSATDMDMRTHPSHTCVLTVWLPLPKFHTSPEGLYTARSVLLGVGCWALG